MAYEKTDAGIAAFKHGDASLAPRERSLLIVIDGRKTKEQLVTIASSLGGSADTIEQLVKRGFIRDPRQVAVEEKIGLGATQAIKVLESGDSSGLTFKGETEKMQALRRYVTRSAQQNLGFFKSGAFVNAADSAGDVEDFRVIRADLLAAVGKSKDAVTAQVVIAGLDTLLLTPVES